MSAVFDLIWKLGGTASAVVWFVLALRLLLVKAPKKWSYALWVLVLIRLIVPVFPESTVSWIDTDASAVIEYDTAIHSVNSPSSDIKTEMQQSETENAVEKNILQPSQILRIVWPYGIAVMLVYGMISLILLKRKLRFAVPVRDNIYAVDYIDSPFVLGLFRPRIYIPATMEGNSNTYAIDHEQYHIRRLDHIVKLLAFILLSFHWVRPMLWVAFWFMCWDMEMSCDEAVLKRLGEGVRAEYADTLLKMSTAKRRFLPAPLAFGEGNPKKRIWNILNWKKPKLWVTVLCIILIVIASVCLLSDPMSSTTEPSDMQIYTGGTCIFEHPTLSGIMEDGSYYRHVAVCDEYIFVFSDDHEWVFAADGETQKTVGEYPFTDTASTFAESETYSREALIDHLESEMGIYAQDLVNGYPGDEITVWKYYNTEQSNAPIISLYYFDGELTWLAQGDDLRIFELDRLPESGAFEPAVSPWQWTSNLTEADVSFIEISYWNEEGIKTKSRSLSVDEIREFVGVLNGVPRENVTNEGISAGLLSPGRYERLTVIVRCGAFSYHLKYVVSDGEVSFMFDQDGWSARYSGTDWYLDDPGVDQWMAQWFEQLKNG